LRNRRPSALFTHRLRLRHHLLRPSPLLALLTVGDYYHRALDGYFDDVLVLVLAPAIAVTVAAAIPPSLTTVLGRPPSLPALKGLHSKRRGKRQWGCALSITRYSANGQDGVYRLAQQAHTQRRRVQWRR